MMGPAWQTPERPARPFAAFAYIYALLRSMIVTLPQGGVTWRGTFYPLAELRKNAAPFFLEPL